MPIFSPSDVSQSSLIPSLKFSPATIVANLLSVPLTVFIFLLHVLKYEKQSLLNRHNFNSQEFPTFRIYPSIVVVGGEKKFDGICTSKY